MKLILHTTKGGKENMKQRKLLSLLIALAMTLAFLPTALAETEGVPGGGNVR